MRGAFVRNPSDSMCATRDSKCPASRGAARRVPPCVFARIRWIPWTPAGGDAAAAAKKKDAAALPFLARRSVSFFFPSARSPCARVISLSPADEARTLAAARRAAGDARERRGGGGKRAVFSGLCLWWRQATLAGVRGESDATAKGKGEGGSGSDRTRACAQHSPPRRSVCA